MPGLVISPYARRGYIDHQQLSFDAYLKFIEDDFLGGQRIDPRADGRPDPRPDVRENVPSLGDLRHDLDFNQRPRAPMLLPTRPYTPVPYPPPGRRAICSASSCRSDRDRGERPLRRLGARPASSRSPIAGHGARQLEVRRR